VSPAKQPVLLCYDGSDDAKHAIEHAGELLSGDALVVTVWQRVIYVLGGFGAASMAPPADTREIDEDVERVCKRTAAEGAERARAAGFDAEGVTVEATGPIWNTVLEFADERDASVIVLGSRGLSGFKSLMLGSVSHGVAQHAHRPVLVVPPAGEDD